ncbi:F-box domain-containing protein [Mycena chlorophos]|uniref:F-box domain-containing protein n=1 Tax=Mycena chlorophos TaxID=658473 RepID=A0A8H6S777_MYCCL|nr:F-box domain-containing protein [Mycena chlorophos]
MASTAALRAQIASLDKETSSQRKHLADLETSRDALVSELNRVAVYPVLTLPPEITSEIFIQCLPVPDEPDDGPVRYTYADAPLLLLRVCTTWAHIARSTPPLWSTLNLDVEDWEPEHIGSIVATWLSAARQRQPLSLHISAFDWDELDRASDGLAAFLRSLGTHSTKITTLILRFTPFTLPLFTSAYFVWEALTELHISNESIAERRR